MLCNKMTSNNFITTSKNQKELVIGNEVYKVRIYLSML